jgi:hypothetical protein
VVRDNVVRLQWSWAEIAESITVRRTDARSKEDVSDEAVFVAIVLATVGNRFGCFAAKEVPWAALAVATAWAVMGGGAEVSSILKATNFEAFRSSVHVGEAAEDVIVSVLNSPLALQFRLAGQIVVRVVAIQVYDVIL